MLVPHSNAVIRIASRFIKDEPATLLGRGDRAKNLPSATWKYQPSLPHTIVKSQRILWLEEVQECAESPLVNLNMYFNYKVNESGAVIHVTTLHPSFATLEMHLL